MQFMKPYPLFRLRLFVSKWWWVMALLGILYLLYFQSIKEKRHLIAQLEERIKELNGEKASSLERKDELLLQIGSFDDPAYVEMTLMKQVGVVPEGQTKVFFTP